MVWARACLETQKLEQLEARMDEIADRVARDRTNAARERTSRAGGSAAVECAKCSMLAQGRRLVGGSRLEISPRECALSPLI
jgi:hypothetical protein